MRSITYKVLFFFLFVSLCCVPAFAEDWKEYKRQHFIVYYKEAPLDFVETVEDMAEYYYNDIVRNFGFTRYESWSWDNRAHIYIYDNQEDFVQSAKRFKWSHGIAAVKKKTIRTFPSAHGFFDSTLPHELGHIIFREFIGFNVYLPLWFEEGVAMYQEKAKRWGANDSVRKAIDADRFIPLDKLSEIKLNNRTKRDIINLFYSEAASVVYYLMTELGDHRFVQLCRKLREGKPFEEALRAVYIRFKNVNDLNTSWVKYLKK